MLLIFDIFTNNIQFNISQSDDIIPQNIRLIQLAWEEYNENEILTSSSNFYIIPEGIDFNESDFKQTISIPFLNSNGTQEDYVLRKFNSSVDSANIIVSHNLDLKLKFISSEFKKYNLDFNFQKIIKVCTMKSSLDFCSIIENGLIKSPKIQELYKKIFNIDIVSIDSADQLNKITSKCFWSLVNKNIIILSKFYEVNWWNNVTEKTKSLLSNHYKFCFEGKCKNYNNDIQYFFNIEDNLGSNIGSLLKDKEIIPLSEIQLEKITYLSLYSEDQEIFEYLKFIKNIKYLEISSTKLIDINKISILEKLEYLAINNCNFKRYASIKPFVNLKHLIIGNISLINFQSDEFYTIFPNVISLKIREKNSYYSLENWKEEELNFDSFSIYKLIKNTSYLQSLTINTYLDNTILETTRSIHNIIQFECSQLKENISPIDIINSFENIKVFKSNFHHNFEMIDINENLKTEELYFKCDEYNTTKYDFTNIKKLKHLKKLELINFKHLQNFDFIENMVSLTYLNLYSTNFDETLCFNKLTNLAILDISYTNVSKLENLILPNLKELNISGTNIKSFIKIPMFTNLEVLVINSTDIFDQYNSKQIFWETNVYLNNLKSLSIESVNFDYKLLDFMPNLNQFYWSNCPLEYYKINSLYKNYPKIKFIISRAII